MPEQRNDRSGFDPEESQDSGNETTGSSPAGSEEHSFWLKRKERLKQELDFRDDEDSRMLVPSSLELGPGAVDKYVISKQIVRMQEPRRLTHDDLDERRIIYPESRNRALVNRFRDLRTKLLEVSGGNNFTLVVSGASSGAGSSFVALNLAAAFAFDQAKTALIIDCNLREPSLHSTLDVMPETGLTDFLDDPDYDISRILYPTGIPRLRLIPAGSRRETPAEFFTSFRMKQFLQAIRRRYPDRFIVLDTAPISESPDARILTELCDYAMLVVPHGKITAATAEQAATAFNPDKFVGAVING
ncbi:polysaccharide biosynthesis protein [Marinobacter sp. EVN1]|jgi:exopolysaccharide/PEP-CTERM locus tyrosine autokinase|nr:MULTISPECIES: polysaccharide biosynthesis protein [Marinobacter]ERS81471.1 polysaccharide biosynthesis protein [Marinobacter sp. EVN1]ERS90320.1 polysaccharide biosynthesis protein [Marinobacter sp. C1S70]MCG8524696.1 polysaccharide biosynthesis protein [Pseudomonadales bacterium]TPW25462.1 polysaccharide biosynthesis protein [Marinobacter nauticus]